MYLLCLKSIYSISTTTMNVNFRIINHSSFRNYYYKYIQLIVLKPNNLLKVRAKPYSNQQCNCSLLTTSAAAASHLTSNRLLLSTNDGQKQQPTRFGGNGSGHCRQYSTNKSGGGGGSVKPPPLTNFPKITWPSLFKSFRNFIMATFIIRPYFDRDFNLPDFVNGSKRAVEVVSKRVADGDVKALHGLVSDDIIPSVQHAVSMMSLSQREQLAVNHDDIYFTFPYQVGIIFDDNNTATTPQKRFVEITMVYHILKGLAVMRSRGEEPPLNMGMLPEYQQRISICNYRFIREFTTAGAADSGWTINLLNHFKPVDDLDE